MPCPCLVSAYLLLLCNTSYPTPPESSLTPPTLPPAPLQGISKVVGDMWAQLPAEEREPYMEAARQDRERYERELRDFQAHYPQVCGVGRDQCGVGFGAGWV